LSAADSSARGAGQPIAVLLAASVARIPPNLAKSETPFANGTMPRRVDAPARERDVLGEPEPPATPARVAVIRPESDVAALEREVARRR